MINLAWSPPIYELIFRQIVSERSVELTLCYYDRDKHYNDLVRVSDWVATPVHGSGIDCAIGSAHITADCAVLRWQASYADTRMIACLWDRASELSIDMWKSNALARHTSLSADSRRLLESV